MNLIDLGLLVLGGEVKLLHPFLINSLDFRSWSRYSKQKGSLKITTSSFDNIKSPYVVILRGFFKGF